MAVIEKRLKKLERFMDKALPVLKAVEKFLDLSRPRVNPAKYCRCDLDRQIINYLIEHEGAGTSEIAEALGMNPKKARHTIGKHMAKIARLSLNDGWDILEFHPEMKEGKMRAWWIDLEQVDIADFHKSFQKG